MVSMGSLILLSTSFFLLICMHSSNARLLSAIVKPSISFQVTEKMVERTPTQTRLLATNYSQSKGDQFGDLLTGNEQDKKIGDQVSKLEGSKIVESSSSHHVALLKGKHVKDPERPPISQYNGKEEVKNPKNDDVVVMDYQPPHRKTPIHNK